MEAINAIINGLDLTKIVPNLENLLGKLHRLAVLAVMAGPVILLILGLMYLFIPPKEANHSFGFRTYFGMGSVEAWRFTQRIAGLVTGGLGLVLTVVMGILCLSFRNREIEDLLLTACRCLLWECGLAALTYLGIFVFTAVCFDRDGNRRVFEKR